MNLGVAHLAILLPSSMTTMDCHNCGSTGATLRCSKCQSVFFCSKQCQRESWKAHKKACRLPAPTAASHPSESKSLPKVDVSWIRKAKVDEEVIEAVHEQYDDGNYELLRRRTKFLRDAKEGGLAEIRASLQALSSLLNDELIVKTAEAIIAMWDGDTITPLMQQLVEDRVKGAKKRAEFVLCGIILEALKDSGWNEYEADLIDILLKVLRTCVDVARRAPHVGDGHGMPPILKHFQVKGFISDIVQNTWDYVLLGQGVSASVDANDLVPPLRQLAMLDCVDPEWNSHGSWDDVLDSLSNKCCRNGGIVRVEADAKLEGISSQLRKARNSMRCKLMAANPSNPMRQYGLGFDAPQKWRYQMKCSTMGCANLESPDRPHELRCKECWYFHWCSEACRSKSCDLSRQHDLLCQATPPDKAAQTRTEAEGIFGWAKDGKNERSSTKTCHGCGIKERSTGHYTTFTKCGHCNDAWYCSTLCKEWDRSADGGEHGV